jgi:hypothetical protein
MKDSLPPFLSVQAEAVLLAIKLQPRASSNEIIRPDSATNELRIRVTAPPVDSAANEALIRLLAGKLDITRRQIELVRGQTSRHKLVRIHGMAAGVVLKKLL